MERQGRDQTFDDGVDQPPEARRMGGSGRLRSLLGWAVFLVVPLYLADQLTKWLICRNVDEGTGFVVIRGFFDIIHVRNTGAAFGILSGIPDPFRTWFFLGITVAALAAVLFAFWKTSGNARLFHVILCLVVAGALGNLTDRFLHGEVVDFLSFYLGSYRWPTFNLADTYISLGMAGLFISILFAPRDSA